MAQEGVSCRKVAVWLSETGVPIPAYADLTVANPGPYTELWSSKRISDMLQNETYIENMVIDANKKDKKRHGLQSRVEWSRGTTFRKGTANHVFLFAQFIVPYPWDYLRATSWCPWLSVSRRA